MRRITGLTAATTHNHPEGIKGAQSVASAIFLARTGKTKEEIKDYIVKEFGYDLSQTLDEIRHTYQRDESCEESVSLVIILFLESTSFEGAVRYVVRSAKKSPQSLILQGFAGKISLELDCRRGKRGHPSVMFEGCPTNQFLPVLIFFVLSLS